VLVPSARTVYGVERVQLVEEGSSEPGGQDAPAEAPVDDKLELLKKTFDATESLFDS